MTAGQSPNGDALKWAKLKKKINQNHLNCWEQVTAVSCLWLQTWCAGVLLFITTDQHRLPSQPVRCRPWSATYGHPATTSLYVPKLPFMADHILPSVAILPKATTATSTSTVSSSLRRVTVQCTYSVFVFPVPVAVRRALRVHSGTSPSF